MTTAINTALQFKSVFFGAIAFITLVCAIVVTVTPTKYAGPRETLAGWHVALTAVCFPLVVSEQRVDRWNQASYFADRLVLVLLTVQVVNFIALVINGEGAGRKDNVVVKPVDAEYGYDSQSDVSFVMLWAATFLLAVIAFVLPVWDKWAANPISQ